MAIITITNNGPDIVETNYWDTDHARAGKIYISINAGTIRLLLPDAITAYLRDMHTAKYVILSRGPWPEQGRAEAFEFLFEDGTDAPFMLHTGHDQWDMVPDKNTAGKKGWKLSVWTRDGKQLELPCRYRIVDRIPYMRPWKG